MTMRQSRHERTEKRREKRTRVLVYILAGVAVVAVLAGVAIGITANSGNAEADSAIAQAAKDEPHAVEATDIVTQETSAAAEPMIEIPSVLHKSVTEARALLQAAGLVTALEEHESAVTEKSGNDREIVAQHPQPGSLADPGSVVVLTIPVHETTVDALEGGTYVVCIDPGHQAHGNSDHEPIGPGSTTTKPKVTGGTSGIETGIAEYEVTLQIAMNLKRQLEAAGVKVVMTRETNDVDISNAERAAISNEAGADLFVRVHCDGNPNSDVCGISTLYPASNQWTSSFAAESKRAAGLVQSGMVAATGADSRGLIARDDISGFNWSKVPVVLVECGFMSNPVEDKLLTSPHYQDKLVSGIADGIEEFLGR